MQTILCNVNDKFQSILGQDLGLTVDPCSTEEKEEFMVPSDTQQALLDLHNLYAGNEALLEDVPMIHHSSASNGEIKPRTTRTIGTQTLFEEKVQITIESKEKFDDAPTILLRLLHLDYMINKD
jgi:hypothetical protein